MTDQTGSTFSLTPDHPSPLPSMNTHNHPAKGLSLSQLVFSLNEELKRAVQCSSFTLDAVSQLDRDASTALATIREWRNSFVPINRVPSEVLSLIPTHLSHEKDLFSASSVCRHWRGTLIQRAVLWSQLDLTTERNDLFVKTLLERAKGSALDIRTAHLDRADTLALLSPHAQRFRTIDFVRDCWSSIQKFSEVASGPLPLLNTLKINASPNIWCPETMSPPSLPLFNGAANLKNLFLHSKGAPFLNHFAFPNLTTFELVTMQGEFPASQLLDFLEASPTLRTVRIEVAGEIHTEDVPSERVIVLPNVEMLSVTQGSPGYGIAACISCTSARLTSLAQKQDAGYMTPLEIFPAWNTIPPQYIASTIDEVALRVTTTGDDILSCFLSFLSPGSATLELGYRITGSKGSKTLLPSREELCKTVSQALKAIRTHPLLSNVKRLRIWERNRVFIPPQSTLITDAAAQLFKSVGPLEELVFDVYDPQLFLFPFFDPPEFQVLSQLHSFPSIKRLTIAEQPGRPFSEECMAAIAGFAESQYTRGVPFELVMFHMDWFSLEIADRLEPWVGTVKFSDKISGDGRYTM